VAHLSDGTLRRMYDEPLAAVESARAHFDGCARCQERFTEIAGLARDLQAALAVPAATVDAHAAYRAVRERAGRPRLTWLPRWGASRGRLAAAGLLAAALVAVVGFGPAVASGLVKIFEPKQVQVVPITSGSLEGFPDLSNWGTVQVTSQPELKQVDSAPAAHQATGLPLLPAALPASVSGLPQPQYAVVGQGAGTFTFDAAKAQAAAQREGAKAPPLPANLNGASLHVVGGPAEAAVYGTVNPRAMPDGQFPQLVIAIGKAPVVTSNGATVRQIEDAVLAQPGVSPQLAAAIRSIGDPTSTLPIPIPADRASSHAVTLQNHDRTRATFIGDNTGIAAAIVWVKNGTVYAVAGSLHEDQLVAVASSLPQA